MEFDEHNNDGRVEGESQPSNLGFAQLRPLGAASADLVCLRSDRVYTAGRRRRHCDLVLLHRCISNRHSQIFLDGSDRKLRLVDGFLLPRRSHLREIKRGFRSGSLCSNLRASLNGIFVNGRRVRKGTAAELSAGDEVLFSCRSGSSHGCRIKCGFVVERIVFSEIKLTSEDFLLSWLECGDLTPRSLFFLSQLRSVLASADPVSYLRNLLDFHQEKQHAKLPSALQHGSPASPDPKKCCKMDGVRTNDSLRVVSSDVNVLQNDKHRNPSLDAVENIQSSNCQLQQDDDRGISYSDGRTFFLNRLKLIGPSSPDQCEGITLPELLHPMKTLVRVFIATFTCDVSWCVASLSSY